MVTIQETYKSIVQPCLVSKCLDAHTFLPKSKFSIVDCLRRNIKKNIKHSHKNVELIRINHYWTRDEKFFQKKILNRQERRSYQKTKTLEGFAANLNNEKDFEIQKFVPELQKRLGL